MALSVTVPDEYGYIVFVLILCYAVFFYLVNNVVSARKKFDVPYPAMYSEKSKQFNCYQRAHQNALESLPFFLVFTLLGGLQHPLVVSAAGVVWCVARIMYARGYYSGDASKRAPGAILGFLSLFVIIGCTVSLALHMVNIL